MNATQIKNHLSQVFEQDYQGYDCFIKNVIDKVFTGEDAFEALPAPEDYLTDENRERANDNGILQILKVGTIDAEEPIEVFDITLSDKKGLQYNRVGIQQFVRSSLFPFTNAFMLFHNKTTEGKDWRFSFAYKATTLAGMTPAKRYTYLFGKNHRARTASERFAKLADEEKTTQNLLNAFSVEALSKDFFDKYKEQYDIFCNFLYDHKSDTNYFGSEFAQWNDKYLRDYVKKMMGRITFIYFLQRKGWMNGDMEYMQNAFQRSPVQDDYLDKFLEPLFFGVLNTKPENRKQLFESEGWEMSLLDEWKDVPYLNGGLFERDDYDKPKSRFTATMFKQLFDFYSSYNFTIDENDPDDAEVGVDPEMLGHIFENLLEDNKDKGAFYTPKEIVQYMCEESIAQYMKNHTDEKLHSAINELIKEKRVSEVLQNQDHASAIYALLQEVKVCDPAIGSGAFPMGVLNVLYHARLLLHPFTKSMNEFVPSEVKREIIQNNIYGVDFERGAIDIARLRFWLALVVDELKPEPLPNLDYKIMQGNSLLESFEGFDLSHIAGQTKTTKIHNKNSQLSLGLDGGFNKNNLQQFMQQYFSTTEHFEKAKLRKYINDEVKSLLFNSLGGTPSTLAHIEQLDSSANSEFFLWHTWFKNVFEKGGFDVVIGNPPYVNVQLMSDEEKVFYRNHYAVFFKRCDLFALFVELGLSILSTNDGIVTFIIPSVVHSNMSYTRLRDLILNHHWLAEVCYTGGDVFNAPTVDTTILICNKKGNQDIMLKNAVNFAEPITKTVPADYFATFNNVISVGGDNDTDALYSKLLNDDFEKVDAHYNVFQGIVTGNNTAFIFENEDEALAKGIEKALLHPLCHGRDIEKYMVRSHDRRILYIDSDVDIEDYPKTKKWLMNFKEALDKRNEGKRDIISWCSLHRPRVKSELDLKEKILLQRTRNEALKTRIVATLDDESVYGMEGIYFIIPKDKQADLHYLLGILNSKPINYLFATKFLNLAIKAEYVKQIRIPASTPVQRQAMVDLVDGILAAKKEDPQADTREMEQEIDRSVCALYGLTKDEIKVVEGD